MPLKRKMCEQLMHRKKEADGILHLPMYMAGLLGEG